MEFLEVSILTENLIFHSSGISFWVEQNTLLIADVHLGKISHFRKHGSAVPQQAIQQNFRELNQVVKEFLPQKIYFLGDLFHSALNSEWILFEEWAKNQSAKIHLIAGNHDIISPVRYKEIGIQVDDELIIQQFLFTHHPEKRKGFFNICGHIHPGFLLRGSAKQFLKLKCFFCNDNQLILPAFGAFTGLYLMNPEEKDQIYVCTKSEVIKVH